jgi:hypothetical protein
MTPHLSPANAGPLAAHEEPRLAHALAGILGGDWRFPLGTLAAWQRVLSDPTRHRAWGVLLEKLEVLFRCGKATPLDGPMIGVTLHVREADPLREVARALGGPEARSPLAEVQWLAFLWNATFADTGIWMGKTFEPVSREAWALRCGGDPATATAYDPEVCRIGRNFFREAAPRGAGVLQQLGLPVLSRLWRLEPRPLAIDPARFDGALREEHLRREAAIPYALTGGRFLATLAPTVLEEGEGKRVYALTYRWPALAPAYPLTRLVDELVQIADGVWLGRLVMATRRFSLGTLHAPLPFGKAAEVPLGEPFRNRAPVEYGYQHNGFFLLIDAALAREAFADDAFPSLRPRPGERAFEVLGYGAPRRPRGAAPPSGPAPAPDDRVKDWAEGWRDDPALAAKFTTFVAEPSPLPGDPDARALRPGDASILQALARVQEEIAAAAREEDHLRHFEPLNRLFRAGVAPRVVDGLFQGAGRGFNVRHDAPEEVYWYGAPEPCEGFDHYHGATLNLHWGFGDTLGLRGPAALDAVWARLGRFVFPWGGKSFQRISGRKLSMLLDESPDLERRYPRRVAELRAHPASWPHAELVRRAARRADPPGPWAARLAAGPWDEGMADADRAYFAREARERWVWGTNVEDRRILVADKAMRLLDMNYAEPLPSIQALARSGPTPFVRHGYVFLGRAGEASILPMNAGKRVFQFHYRFPLVGGPFPIGYCLDELVEIAEGLFLGQLIYATDLARPFHSSVDPAAYRYQLFGYFLLLDHDWQRHRRAIGLDVDV